MPPSTHREAWGWERALDALMGRAELGDPRALAELERLGWERAAD